MKRYVIAALLVPLLAFSAERHFSTFKKVNDRNDSTLLVIGGIHGDEPGGYMAAMLLEQHYKVSSGNLIIVPNLNYDSIMAFKRGVYGDMNRKFVSIYKQDPDYQIITDIKKIIAQPQVDLVLNLHDGHGFYRPTKIDNLKNPIAWGQSAIIDQGSMEGTKWGELEALAKEVTTKVNVSLVEDVHEFNIKNTDTKNKSKDMQLSLTYFAVKNGIPALAIETSKNITQTNIKVFYQLQSIEHFMSILGIKFERDFDLTLDGVVSVMPPQNGMRKWFETAIEKEDRLSSALMQKEIK